ncbi:hypothetical protein B0H14DRAFT_2577098 [Mycena olivaceomarginata]|nr:hypothetical protein B0H14DRAFT_2577098 [Mycena olivaceomarginata]
MQASPPLLSFLWRLSCMPYYVHGGLKYSGVQMCSVHAPISRLGVFRSSIRRDAIPIRPWTPWILCTHLFSWVEVRLVLLSPQHGVWRCEAIITDSTRTRHGHNNYPGRLQMAALVPPSSLTLHAPSSFDTPCSGKRLLLHAFRWFCETPTQGDDIRQLHIRTYHQHIYVHLWYRPGFLFGLISGASVTVLNLQTLLEPMWWAMLDRRRDGHYLWDKGSYRCQSARSALTRSNPHPALPRSIPYAIPPAAPIRDIRCSRLHTYRLLARRLCELAPLSDGGSGIVGPYPVLLAKEGRTAPEASASSTYSARRSLQACE